MDDIQRALKQKLVEHTQQLVARGGPAAVRTTGSLRLYYEPVEWWRYEPPRAGETFWPLAAVLTALEYSSLHTLQEDWNEALGHPGPLPMYLYPTAEGHYTAMIGETAVLTHLIVLTAASDAVMRAD